MGGGSGIVFKLTMCRFDQAAILFFISCKKELHSLKHTTKIGRKNIKIDSLLYFNNINIDNVYFGIFLYFDNINN